jgi:hypothetical protein
LNEGGEVLDISLYILISLNNLSVVGEPACDLSCSLAVVPEVFRKGLTFEFLQFGLLLFDFKDNLEGMPVSP